MEFPKENVFDVCVHVSLTHPWFRGHHLMKNQSLNVETSKDRLEGFTSSIIIDNSINRVINMLVDDNKLLSDT